MIINNVMSTVKLEGKSIVIEFSYEDDKDIIKIRNESDEYFYFMLYLYSLDFNLCIKHLPKKGELKPLYEKALINNFISVLMKRVLPNMNRHYFYDCVNIEDLIKFIDVYEEKGYDLNIKRPEFNDINIFTMSVLSFLNVEREEDYEKLKCIYYHLFNKENIDKTHEHLLFGNALDIFKNEINDEQCKERAKMIEELEILIQNK